MSFLKKLFGGKPANNNDSAPAASAEHQGFAIAATPYQEQGQWQLCGVISKEVEGARKQHRFIRADRFPTAEQAAEATLAKACQIIDQQGEKLFG